MMPEKAKEALNESLDEDGSVTMEGLRKAHKIMYGRPPVFVMGLRLVDSYSNLFDAVIDETGPYDERDLVSAELLEQIESGQVLT